MEVSTLLALDGWSDVSMMECIGIMDFPASFQLCVATVRNSAAIMDGWGRNSKITIHYTTWLI